MSQAKMDKDGDEGARNEMEPEAQLERQGISKIRVKLLSI